MRFPFNLERTIQAAAVLLKCEETRRMSRLRLLKLLYIADRESLTERGRPITGDRPVAMDHGPVLSNTYDLIKGEAFDSPRWDEFLRRTGRDVVLAVDPGVGKLTRKEIVKLHEVAARFVDEEDYYVADHTHGFAEWQKNKPAPRSAKAIPIDDLLEATGRLADKQAILSDAENEATFDALLRGGTPSLTSP